MSEMNGNDFCYSSIALDSYFYGITFGNVEVTGYLDAKNYTSNYPLSDVHYSGPSSDKYYYVEYARLSINVLMAVLNDITEQTEGLSMSDLGFKSYQ